MRGCAKALTAAVGVWAMISAAPAEAASVVDLTGGPGSSGTINGAIFEFSEHQPTGTGVFGPFLRISSGKGELRGYNSSGDIPGHFDVVSGGNDVHTHDLQFGDLGVVDREGTNYLAFSLDINEPGGPKSLLSLDTLQIYTNPFGEQVPNDPANLGTLAYDMDGSVLMDASLSSGSGSSDMDFFIPLSNFLGVQASDFLYLYAEFGATPGFESAAGGFHEFAALSGGTAGDSTSESSNPVVVPTPTAAAGGMLLLMGVLAGRAWRKRAS